ncbi:hypothetical protein [Helicobacter saguini]|uniref:Uncharacterized protein n=1 Tax=Helicobacter saguini TaxID=1548018 RepID=A0A6L7D7Y2_9HELI|nr:hypothetical protein [Helicobacter saguini]MWV70377.1 hypothetical protein [Helicobacter saguini]
MGLIKLIKSSKIYKDYRAGRKEKGAFERDLKFFTKRHQTIFGYTPDFANPKTFNEKINHRSLYDRNPLYTPLADKLKARIYINFMLRDFVDSVSLDSQKTANNAMGGGKS